MQKFGLLLAVTFLASSAFAGSLRVTLASDEAYLIDAATSSCSSVAKAVLAKSETPVANINSRYFSLQMPQLYWSGTRRNFVLDKVVVEFKDKAIQPQKVAIVGDELKALFAEGDSSSNYAPWKLVMGPNTTKAVWGLCQAISFGGFTITPDANKDFVGIVHVIGHSADGSGHPALPDGVNKKILVHYINE